jgi:hypothetical protein
MYAMAPSDVGLSRYLQFYGQEHCKAMKIILRYLVLTKNYTLDTEILEGRFTAFGVTELCW